MKNYLVVLVGVPGSGKSTEAKNLKTKYESEGFQVRIFSSDAYRKEMFGSECDQSHNGEIFEKLYKDSREFLATSNNAVAIIDSTNVSLKHRLHLLKSVYSKLDVWKQCVVMCVPIEECLNRDKVRERVCGKEVISKYIEAFQFPQYFEGWDEIKIVNENRNNANKYFKSFLNGCCDVMKGFNQNNPHHDFDLLTHSLKLARHYEVDSHEHTAALLHDIGKLFTETTDSNGISHYYNHANVGAYIVASNIANETPVNHFVGYMLFLINYHMLVKNISAKSEAKYRNIFGDEWYNSLRLFSKYDDESAKEKK